MTMTLLCGQWNEDTVSMSTNISIYLFLIISYHRCRKTYIIVMADDADVPLRLLLFCIRSCLFFPAGYTSLVEVLGMYWDSEGEDSSKTSSSMPSAMGFIFAEVLVPGDFSKNDKNITTESIKWFRYITCWNLFLLTSTQGLKTASPRLEQPNRSGHMSQRIQTFIHIANNSHQRRLLSNVHP